MCCSVLFLQKRTDVQTVPDDMTGVSGKQIDFNNKDSHPYNLIRKPFLSNVVYVGVLIIDQVKSYSTLKFWRGMRMIF